MTERQPEPGQGQSLVARLDQPLIGIPFEEDGRDMVRYFTDEADLEAASTPASVQRALSLLGAWQDLGDWAEVERELDRIRHESKPTPPIELCG